MRLENCLALRAERTGARWLGSALLAVVAIVSCNVSTGFGSTKEFRAKQAARLVQEALHREIDGLNQERDALLTDALRQLPNFAPAMWHRGFVRVGKRWVSVNDVADLAERNKQLEAWPRLSTRSPFRPPPSLLLCAAFRLRCGLLSRLLSAQFQAEIIAQAIHRVDPDVGTFAGHKPLQRSPIDVGLLGNPVVSLVR